MLTEIKLDELTNIGQDGGKGNLLAVQPYMLPVDYRSADSLIEKLAGYLEAARQAGWITPRTIAVFPEYLGTWLVAVGEGEAVYRAATVDRALRPIVLRHLPAFLRAFWESHEPDRTTASVFRMAAERMARDYTRVFSNLSQRFGITVVAGSILLPNPQVVEGVVVAGHGPLFNVTAVFGLDGKAYPALTFKAFPIEDELPFITAAFPVRPERLPVFDTPAGRLGVLICADSWYPETYACLVKQGVDLVAVPSFASGDGHWEIPWAGYNGAPAPADVDASDVGRLSESQAWHKYALAGRLGLSGARAGTNVFLHGRLWNLGSDSGLTLSVDGAGVYDVRASTGAILNLWL